MSHKWKYILKYTLVYTLAIIIIGKVIDHWGFHNSIRWHYLWIDFAIIPLSGIFVGVIAWRQKQQVTQKDI
jgi:hypothetical protein